MRLPRTCRHCASAFVRSCDCGQRLSPSWRLFGWVFAVGRAGGPCRGRCKYVHVSSVAACSCALSCAHGKTGVGRPAQPARGMPQAHAAHAPARPTRPAFDSFLWPLATEERKKSNGGSRAFLARSRAWLGSTRALQNQRKRTRRKPRPFSFPSVRHQPNALAHRHRETIGGHFMDGFTACPANPHRPAQPSATQSRFVVQPTNSRLYQAVASARRRRTTARQRGASTSSPIGQLTLVPPMPQYPFGFFARYCW